MKSPTEGLEPPLVLPQKPAPVPAPPAQQPQREFEKDDWLSDGLKRQRNPETPSQATAAWSTWQDIARIFGVPLKAIQLVAKPTINGESIDHPNKLL